MKIKRRTKQKAGSEEFDRRFDEGEDLESLGVDLSKARRPGLESRRINIDVPAYFIDRLDHAAQLRGITRQSLTRLGSTSC